MTNHVDRITEQDLADHLVEKVVSKLEWPCKLIHVLFNTDILNEQYRVTVTVEPKENAEHGKSKG